MLLRYTYNTVIPVHVSYLITAIHVISFVYGLTTSIGYSGFVVLNTVVDDESWIGKNLEGDCLGL
jgi:hypothetical protein